MKDQGNACFKAGNYLKAAALYTQAIKLDPENPALYSNRSAAFLNLMKLTKALADAETTIKLKPTWEKGFFRKGSALEAMERYDEALATYREALAQNPSSSEVATKVKRLTQIVRDKKRSQQDKKGVESNGSSDVSQPDAQRLDGVVDGALPPSTSDEIRKFAKETVALALKEWNDKNGTVDANVRLCLGKDATKETVPNVAVEKAFESPDTLNSCAGFLRQYVVESSATAACLIVAKKSIAFPQVWKGSGSRKWVHGNSNGFFLQLETSTFRRLWFVPSTVENGRNTCRNLEPLDVDSHAVLPPLFR